MLFVIFFILRMMETCKDDYGNFSIPVSASSYSSLLDAIDKADHSTINTLPHELTDEKKYDLITNIKSVLDETSYSKKSLWGASPSQNQQYKNTKSHAGKIQTYRRPFHSASETRSHWLNCAA